MVVAMNIVNVSGYKFLRIYDIFMQRENLYEALGSLGVLGKIMLSAEGINLMLAGTRQQIDAFYAYMKQDSRYADMAFKESFSNEMPFDRLRIKYKQHIVPSPIPVDPEAGLPGMLPAKDLKTWLDEGREITILDTRNTYEIEEGAFDKAIHFDLDNFREIYDHLKACPEDMKKKPLVMYCTGGIRCEKGAPLAMEAGFEEVYQLEGGILKYFEEIGQEHYHGKCFVFDERETVSPKDIQGQ